MKKTGLTLILSGALMAIAAAPAFAYTPQRDQRQANERHEYHFKPENKAVLQKHMPNRSHVDWNRREHLVAGNRLPSGWHAHIRPVPEAVIRELPPIPAGLEIGYYDGYCVVYDPNTLEIVEVLDLQ